MTADATFTYGVYGLGLVTDLRLSGLATNPPAHWPRWRLRIVVGPAPSPSAWVMNDESGRMAVGEEGWVAVERASRTITLTTCREVRPEGIVHPLLSQAVALISHWSGRTTIHAGAVVVEDRAIALLAPRGGGKSTTTAMLVDAGAELLTDDLLVLEAGTAFPGPSTIDLRQESAGVLGGTDLGRIGRRRRFRHPRTARALPVKLGAWVFLEWGERVAVERLPASSAVEPLAASCPLPQPPEVVLDLLSVPCLRYRRPRSIENARASLAPLLTALGARMPPR